MAPLPPNSTKRYYLDYDVASKQHTLIARCDSAVTAAQASTYFDNFLSALSPVLFQWTVLGMRVSAAGSNISVPASFTGTGLYGTGTGTPADSGGYASWVGRSGAGVRGRVTVFGSTVTATGGNWRAAPGENTTLDAALVELRAPVDFWWAVDALKINFNSYTNNGYNAYWRNHTR